MTLFGDLTNSAYDSNNERLALPQYGNFLHIQTAIIHTIYEYDQ